MSGRLSPATGSGSLSRQWYMGGRRNHFESEDIRHPGVVKIAPRGSDQDHQWSGCSLREIPTFAGEGKISS